LFQHRTFPEIYDDFRAHLGPINDMNTVRTLADPSMSLIPYIDLKLYFD